MGSFIKCFDAVSMVVDEATSRFAPIWKENKESKKRERHNKRKPS